MFAQGCGATPTNADTFDYSSSTDALILRGILKYKIMRQCWQDNRTFYYMDTGYVGNQPNPLNPNGWKLYHRIVKNDIQHGAVIPRPADRWEKLQKKLQPWRRGGSQIIVAAPDEKPCRFYGIDQQQWINNTVSTLKQHTDRPVVVRQRAKSRAERTHNNTLEQALQHAWALVTFNSVAATESVMLGVPAFTLAPANAASPVCLQDITKIETPFYPDMDQVHAWACHLAYGQFHVSELKNGSALKILES